MLTNKNSKSSFRNHPFQQTHHLKKTSSWLHHLLDNNWNKLKNTWRITQLLGRISHVSYCSNIIQPSIYVDATEWIHKFSHRTRFPRPLISCSDACPRFSIIASCACTGRLLIIYHYSYVYSSLLPHSRKWGGVRVSNSICSTQDSIEQYSINNFPAHIFPLFLPALNFYCEI